MWRLQLFSVRSCDRRNVSVSTTREQLRRASRIKKHENGEEIGLKHWKHCATLKRDISSFKKCFAIQFLGEVKKEKWKLAKWCPLKVFKCLWYFGLLQGQNVIIHQASKGYKDTGNSSKWSFYHRYMINSISTYLMWRRAIGNANCCIHNQFRI